LPADAEAKGTGDTPKGVQSNVVETRPRATTAIFHHLDLTDFLNTTYG
jgi:hypothetical protein